MHAPALVTPASELPVTLELAKQHLRVDGNEEDAVISVYISACVAHLDGYAGILGRCLVSQVWRQDFDRWSRCLRLPFPSAGVISVDVYDAYGNISTIDSDQFSLLRDELGSYVRFETGCSPPPSLAETRGIGISFMAGYGAADVVPESIKAAILLAVGDLYHNREAKVSGLLENRAVDDLLAPYRLMGS